MLDSQDIKLLQNMIVTTIGQQLDERFDEQNRKWEQRLDERFDKQDKKWEEKLERILDKRFAESENMILEELDRVEILRLMIFTLIFLLYLLYFTGFSILFPPCFTVCMDF